MKLIHLSDLHIGKRVYEYSMNEDQQHIISEILGIIADEAPDCVMIAGDVYDRPVPSADAVGIFDDMLFRLSETGIPVFIISGNHDSPERLAFGNRLIDKSGIHLSPVYDGNVTPFTLHDSFGDVNIYMLPFIKPASVRRFFEDEEISSYTDAVKAAVSHMEIDTSARNILVTHQFVTGALRSESEDISVGGTDNVDASVFDCFDYVALGHLHRPQNVGSERIRYCGSPLKYSFSEAGHEKSVTVAELSGKGSLTVRTVPLVPLHDMKELKGSYEELTLKSTYENTSYRDDYMHITLTDELDIPDAVSKLRVIYRNLMKLDYDNARTRSGGTVTGVDVPENMSPAELFARFYKQQNGCDMTDEQTAYIRELTENTGGEQK